MREGRELGASSHGAQEIGFEGALVDVAEAEFAAFVEDVVEVEVFAGGQEAVNPGFPEGGAIGLVGG